MDADYFKLIEAQEELKHMQVTRVMLQNIIAQAIIALEEDDDPETALKILKQED